MKKFVFFFALALLLVTCNKPLTKYNSNFEGTWYSTPVYNTTFGTFVSDQFTFSGKDGKYKLDCKDTCAPDLCDCLGELTGKAEINKQRNMIRLRGTANRTFVLEAEPYQAANGKWMMDVDGKTYTKQ